MPTVDFSVVSVDSAHQKYHMKNLSWFSDYTVHFSFDCGANKFVTRQGQNALYSTAAYQYQSFFAKDSIWRVL